MKIKPIGLLLTAATAAVVVYVVREVKAKDGRPAMPSAPQIVDEGVGANGVQWRVVTWPSADAPAADLSLFGTNPGFVAQIFHDGRWRWLHPVWVEAHYSREQAISYLQRVADGIVGFGLLSG